MTGPLVKVLLDALLPLHCVLCGGRPAGCDALCEGCRAELPWSHGGCRRCAEPLPAGGLQQCRRCLAEPPAFQGTVAAMRYTYPVPWLVRGLKFEGRLELAMTLAELLARRVRMDAGVRPAALVAVPLHRSRLRARGFDQARLIAARLGARLGLPVLDDGLERVRPTAAQSGLGSRAARARNLRGAFRARRLDGLEIALVDDVLTTGATARAASQALLAGGAQAVTVWVCARAGYRDGASSF